MLERKKLSILLPVAGDIAIFYFSLLLMLLMRYPESGFFAFYWKLHWPPFTILFLIWILTFVSAGLYQASITKNEFTFTKRLARAAMINAFLGIFLFYSIPAFKITPRANLFIVLLVSSISIFIWRHILNTILANRDADRVLFFGISKEVADFARYLTENPQFGLSPVAYIETASVGSEINIAPIYPVSQNINSIVARHQIDLIIISHDVSTNAEFSRILFDTLPLGVRFMQFPDFYESITGKIPVSLITEAWILKNFVSIKSGWYERIKRLVDIILALIAAIPVLALTPFIALLITLDSSGPILYRQKRIGKRGQEIEIVKFRSMVTDAEKGTALWADENDPRVTRIGRMLRKTRIDEFPQLWNVLLGEMSFIGPRPERPEFVATLKKEIPFYEMRHLVAPGLTGWAQINFPYGASIKDALEKLQYDLYYIKHRSIIIDLDILLRTIMVILTREGR